MAADAPIKAIETRYKGHRFRSRLEARWAVFLDSLGVEWSYEAEGYRLGDGTMYLPDFRLPKTGAGCFVEIKPSRELTQDDDHKAARLAIDSDGFVMVVCGNPWPGEHRVLQYRRKPALSQDQLDCFWLSIERANRFLFSDLASRWSHYDLAAVVVEGHKAFPELSKYPPETTRHVVSRRPICWCDQHKAMSFGFMLDEYKQCKHCGEVSEIKEANPYAQCFAGDAERSYDCDPSCDAPELLRAFEAARGARFEHGETPR